MAGAPESTANPLAQPTPQAFGAPRTRRSTGVARTRTATWGDALVTARNADGGWPTRAGGASEPEPTALATLALDDAGGRAWLSARQESDGSWALEAGPVRNTSSTGLAALAVGPGPQADAALDYLERTRAARVPPNPAAPHDPDARGWAWTEDTFGWVEPTSRALLALRILRPGATPAIDEALALLADRACVAGGWNYGNRVVLEEVLPPFGQPTAAALVALQGDPPDLTSAGRAALARLWPAEPGGLTLAMTLVALHLAGSAAEAAGDLAGAEQARTEAGAVAEVLRTRWDTSGFLGDVQAMAWATIATGDGWQRLRRPR